MKTNSAQIEQTMHQLKAKAIPAEHPMIPQLERLFGEHAYFLDGNGLSIVEPIEPDQNDGRVGGVAINLASRTDAKEQDLQPREPEPTA